MRAIVLQLTVVPCRSMFPSWRLGLLMTATPYCHRCEPVWGVLRVAAHWLDSSGWIRYVICNWTCVVIYPMLWGELGTREVILTWLTHLASHQYHSAKRHLSRIQKDPDISHCHLPGCQHLQRSGCRNDNNAYFSGYAELWMKTIANRAHWCMPEESIISGTYQCTIGYREDITLLVSVCWILSTAWEILALCLVVWIAVQHFRELRQQSAAGMIRNCFTVLIKTHVLYFARWVHTVNIAPISAQGHASFVAVSCFSLVIDSSPTLSAVCAGPCMWPWFITSIGKFPGQSDLWWVSSAFAGRTVVCAGTTPDPWRSRISREARSWFWRSNWHGHNGFPGAHSYIDWQWCVAREILGEVNCYLVIRWVRDYVFGLSIRPMQYLFSHLVFWRGF
jgi:hypothetical protein